LLFFEALVRSALSTVIRSETALALLAATCFAVFSYLHLTQKVPPLSRPWPVLLLGNGVGIALGWYCAHNGSDRLAIVVGLLLLYLLVVADAVLAFQALRYAL